MIVGGSARNSDGCRGEEAERPTPQLTIEKPIEVHIGVNANPLDRADADIATNYRVKIANREIMLNLLTRPENVVHFFRDLHGVGAITKEVLRQRSTDYQQWVEAFARKGKIPMQSAEKGATGASRPTYRKIGLRLVHDIPFSIDPCGGLIYSF